MSRSQPVGHFALALSRLLSTFARAVASARSTRSSSARQCTVHCARTAGSLLSSRTCPSVSSSSAADELVDRAAQVLADRLVARGVVDVLVRVLAPQLRLGSTDLGEQRRIRPVAACQLGEHQFVAAEPVDDELDQVPTMVQVGEVVVVLAPPLIEPLQHVAVPVEGEQHPVGVVVAVDRVDDRDGQGDDVVVGAALA